jgi:multiple sugar transport system substrate-binding protein
VGCEHQEVHADDRHRRAHRRRRLGGRAPKAAVAANVGSGPDIIISTMEDAHQYPDKLVDVTDVATYLGNKYGGWYEAAKAYGMHGKKWVAIMMGAAGNASSIARACQGAGFDSVPRDLGGFLKLCQALKAKGTPPASRSATPPATRAGRTGSSGRTAASWSTPRTTSSSTARDDRGARVREAALRDVHPGHAVVARPNNNKAFLDGQISLTANGISVYYAAKNSPDAKLQEMAKDVQHAYFPVGKDGKSRELNLVFPMMIFKYSKYPNAAKEYLRFMMEREQYVPWQEASIGYVCHPLGGYESSKFWTADPKNVRIADCFKNMTPNGYAGELGYASAACVADFIIPNMVAEAASGSKSPKEAAERAQKRAERYYKV